MRPKPRNPRAGAARGGQPCPAWAGTSGSSLLACERMGFYRFKPPVCGTSWSACFPPDVLRKRGVGQACLLCKGARAPSTGVTREVLDSVLGETSPATPLTLPFGAPRRWDRGPPPRSPGSSRSLCCLHSRLRPRAQLTSCAMSSMWRAQGALHPPCGGGGRGSEGRGQPGPDTQSGTALA